MFSPLLESLLLGPGCFSVLASWLLLTCLVKLYLYSGEQRTVSLQVDCLEETLEKSLQEKGSSDLRVSILLDYTRGSRGRCYKALIPSKACFTVRLEHLFFQKQVAGARRAKLCSVQLVLSCLVHLSVHY